jgi:MoaD family protein
MKITIKLLRPFSEIVGKSELILDFNGNTLDDLIKILIDKYPQLKKELLSETEELSEYLCIFVNDNPVTALDGLDTKLKIDDEIIFFIPVSGG